VSPDDPEHGPKRRAIRADPMPTAIVVAVVVFCFLAAACAPSSLLGARLRNTIKMVMLFVLPAIIFVTLGPAFFQLIRTLMAGR